VAGADDAPWVMGEALAQVVPPDYTRRLSRAELDSITPATLVERMRALAPLVASHAAEAEAQRKPVDAVIDKIHESGVFHHFVPKRYGGLEFGVMDFVDSMLPLSAADASTGWVTAFCMEHNLLLSLFPEQTQDEIFAAQPYIIAPACAFPPGSARKVPGGFRLTGRWRFGSGVMHADWGMGMAVDTDDNTNARWFLFPLSEATVYDVWHMDGMSGTGSNDFALDDVFVPEHRGVGFGDLSNGTTPGSRLHPNPMYRVSIAPFLAIASALPMVGAAQGAVAACIDQLATRVSLGAKQADRQAVQMALAESDTEVHFAELAVRDAVHELMRLAESDNPSDVEVRARIRARVVAATWVSKGAVRRIVDILGTSVHDSRNPIQRALRDLTVATGHVLHDRSAAMELQGRVLLGLPPQPTLY
jgi:alkylation response protein AidB-like acyl-CoA dehydrogenase